MTHRLRVIAASLLVLGSSIHARDEPTWVPLQRISSGDVGGWIGVKVTAGGHDELWLLDTGASRNLLSPAFASRLGLVPAGDVRADTPMGAVKGGSVALPTLRVGQLDRDGQDALVVDLRSLFGSGAEGIVGVLGVPFLAGLQLELDLRAWRSAWQPAGKPECPPLLSAMPVRMHRGLPVVAIGIGTTGVTEAYVLDTGNPAGLVRIEAEQPEPSTPGLVVPGDMRLTVLPQATLGAQTRNDVPVTRMTAAALRGAIKDNSLRGLAGTAVLDGARWRVNLAAKLLCVESGRFATPGGFGLTLEREGQRLRIGLVLPNGPAERAGLRNGDEVTQWAGGDPVQSLQSLWAAAQGQDELTLTAGQPARTVTLKRAIFAPVTER
jgi:Aspartyl protease